MDSQAPESGKRMPWMDGVPAPTEVVDATPPTPQGAEHDPLSPPRWGAERVHPTEGMRHLPQDVQERMLEQKRQNLERLDPWGPVVQKRARICALVWALLCPLMLILVAGAPALSLILAIPLGGLMGYWTGMRRSSPTEHFLATAGVCMFCQAVPGTLALNFMLVFGFLFYGIVGAIGGVHHSLRASDGQ